MSCMVYAAMVDEGEGGPKDPSESRRALKKACDAGDDLSCSALKNKEILEKKQAASGTQSNFVQAGAAYRRAEYQLSAEKYKLSCDADSDGEGCHNYAVAVEKGPEVAQDLPSARLYYDKACKLGFTHSCNNLAVMVENGKGGMMDQAWARDRYREL